MSEQKVVRIDRGWGRVIRGELTSGGHQLVIHLTGADDESSIYKHYVRGAYDARCAWCYLGANHSVDAHAVRVSA